MSTALRLLTTALVASHASSFSVMDGVHLVQTATSSVTHQLPQLHLLEGYRHTLEQYPLPTEIVTGATLAVTGDAIAQSQDESVPYDKKRAGAFMCFDVAYRVCQHFAFPVIIAGCQGQFLGSVPLIHDNVDVFQLATIERTLANQLGIIPFLYYPCFFAMTGFVQGLSVSTTVTRAQETFLFLFSRNLLFWIPVQYVQFGFVPENLQIPFVCAAGLVWTTILSLLAGSTQSYGTTPEEDIAVAMEELLTPSSSTGAALSPSKARVAAQAANATAVDF